MLVFSWLLSPSLTLGPVLASLACICVNAVHWFTDQFITSVFGASDCCPKDAQTKVGLWTVSSWGQAVSSSGHNAAQTSWSILQEASFLWSAVIVDHSWLGVCCLGASMKWKSWLLIAELTDRHCNQSVLFELGFLESVFFSLWTEESSASAVRCHQLSEYVLKMV